MNVLFIMVDQWRGDCLSLLGHPHVRTPHLDALAADGTAFRRHFGQASPCGPSRASVLTGMYLHNHRSLLNGTPLDARHTNVALEARAVGYDPALFGYTDVSLDPRHYDIEHGYEGVLPGLNPVCHINSSWEPWFADLASKGYDIPANPQDMFRPQANYPGADNKGPTFAPAQYTAEDSNTAFLVDETIRYVSANQDTPWFAHLSFISPHPPFIVPAPYHDMYDADDMDEPRRRETPELESEQHPWIDYFVHNQAGSGYSVGVDSADNLSLSDRDTRQIKATYFAMIAEVDAQIGRLVNHLKESGSYDDTLIVFTSDHGEHLGDHWMYAKYSYYQQTFHVPLIIRDPTSAADAVRGTVVDAFTESVDIMPTILESIGATPPRQCDGRSLLPFCRGTGPADWRDAYHAAFDMRGPAEALDATPLGLKPEDCVVHVLCDENYKYVHFATLPPVLFDLKNDPDEFENLADLPAYQNKIMEYRGKMLSWRMQHETSALTNMHLTQDGFVELTQ